VINSAGFRSIKKREPGGSFSGCPEKADCGGGLDRKVGGKKSTRKGVNRVRKEEEEGSGEDLKI